MKHLYLKFEPGYRPYMLSALLLGLSYPSFPFARLEWLAWVWLVPMLLALRSVTSFPRFIRNVFLTLLGAGVICMAWLLTSSVLGTVLLFFLYAFVLSLPFIAFYFIRHAFGWRAALWTLPIIWTAIPTFLPVEKVQSEFIAGRLANWHVPLLAGTFDARVYSMEERPPLLAYEDRNTELVNAAVLLEPPPYAGRHAELKYEAIYHKQVLMPFVERVPFADRYPWLSRLAFDFGVGRNLGVGREATVFDFTDQRGERVRIAAAICYEQLYPAKVAALVRNGAEMLALMTNEGWWSKSHGEYQVAAFSRLRAIETRRTIARCANTGLTCLIDPLGRVSNQVPWWSEQTVMGDVRLSDEMSLYVRYPDYFPKGCLWFALGLAVAALLQKVRARIRASKSLQWNNPAPPVGQRHEADVQ